MCKPTARRATPWLLGLGLLWALLPLSAGAQERIQSVRLGRHPGYQRIVLELPNAVEAGTTGEPRRIEIDAEPPSLAPELRDQLAALGVRLERSGTRTRIVLEPGATGPWTAFRLTQGAPRIVVDLGAGAPGLPPDAEILREIAAPAEPSPPSAVLPDVALDPPSPPPQPPQAEPDGAEVRVRVQGLDLVGLLPQGPTRDEILELVVFVRRTPNGDWAAAKSGTDAQRMSLRELTSSTAAGPALTGSVLQHLVERIAAAYADRGLYGTRVDIRQSDVKHLLEQAGPLVIHIRGSRVSP